MTWEATPKRIIVSYEEWKRETGVTDEDERAFMERRKRWRDPGKPEVIYHPIRRLRSWWRVTG